MAEILKSNIGSASKERFMHKENQFYEYMFHANLVQYLEYSSDIPFLKKYMSYEEQSSTILFVKRDPHFEIFPSRKTSNFIEDFLLHSEMTTASNPIY